MSKVKSREKEDLVVFVDDKFQRNESVIEKVAERGFRTHLFTQPTRVLESAFDDFVVDESVKCIVLDVMMPVPERLMPGAESVSSDDTGYAIRKALLAKFPEIPVVYFSAKDRGELAKHATKNALDDSVPKSSENAANDLADRVTQVINRKPWYGSLKRQLDKIVQRRGARFHAVPKARVNGDVYQECLDALRAISSLAVASPEIGHTPRGGIQFEWNRGNSGIEIEFYQGEYRGLVDCDFYVEINGRDEIDLVMNSKELDFNDVERAYQRVFRNF